MLAIKGPERYYLSSSEAEFVAMSEAVKEIRLIYYLLKGMGIDIEIPIIIRSDNV
jgi:hypothetical protein